MFDKQKTNKILGNSLVYKIQTIEPHISSIDFEESIYI